MTVDNLTALGARDDLLWIAAHWTDLRNRLRPGGGNALTGMARGADTALPIDVAVSDLMHEITECVARYYARILMEETDWTPQTSHMPGLLRGVAERYGHFTTADDRTALAFCDEASDYRDRVRHTLERPAPPTPVGPCQTPGCEGQLYLREGRDAGRCRECGAPFTLVEQRAWLYAQFADRLMTASEITSALVVLGAPVPFSTVRSWVARGRLPRATALTDEPLYRLADAKALADARLRRVA